MTLKIVLDSGSDMPIDMAEKNNIDILPLTVISNDIEYRDGLDISSKELTDRMKLGDMFTTSQVTYEQFYNKFNEELDKGNEILYISLSAGISGCYNSSVLAKNEILEERPDAKIHTFNGNCASFGIGLIALRASMMIKEGYSTEEVLDMVKFLADNTEHYFTVEDMKYLYRGGRVSAAQKILGGMLNIKPMLTVNKENGKLVPMDKARGLKHVYRKMIENIKDVTVGNEILEEQTIAVFHSDSIENAKVLRDMIQEELNIEDIIMGNIGSTIAAHTGPGCIVVFISKKAIGKDLDKIKQGDH